MVNEISLWFTPKEFILTLVLYANGDNVVPLFLMTLVLKSETNLPSTYTEGIVGIFSLYKNLFNMDQHVLGAALKSLSLLVILSM